MEAVEQWSRPEHGAGEAIVAAAAVDSCWWNGLAVWYFYLLAFSLIASPPVLGTPSSRSPLLRLLVHCVLHNAQTDGEWPD